MKIFLFMSMIVGISALLISGCGTTVKYGDAQSLQTVSTDFSSSDLQQTAEFMVDSLLAFPPIVEVTKDRCPVITVDKIKNKTLQHIDTESVTDSIRAKLVKSGKFRFIDRTTDQQTVEEIRIQQESGLVDKNTAVQFGKQIGAEYLLTGNISEIQQKDKKVRDVYYKITLTLKNLTTGILEWTDEKEIRKISTR